MSPAAPTIAALGTEEQRARFLRPLYTGEHIYCQLFSEPGAGSDLAGVATRAVRDGDSWVINGEKWFNSVAAFAEFHDEVDFDVMDRAVAATIIDFIAAQLD